jgi:DNA repair exonuclease SbcCD ATPase subunit
MKQLRDFESWANDIYEAAVNPKTGIEKSISRDRDIVYQATRSYPELTKDQALGLYLDDKLKQFDTRDLEQNAVINAQRRENAKLTSNLTKMQQELETVAQSGEQSDAEINRLKTLSGKISTDVEQRKVNATEVEKALAQVEELKNKPGMNDEQYNQLKQDLEYAKKNIEKINPQEFTNLVSQIKTMSGEQSLEKEKLKQLGDVAAKVTSQQKDIETQKADVSGKIAQIEKKQQELEQREKEIGKEIEDKVKQAISSDRTQKYRKAVGKRSKQASTLIKNFLNKDLPKILSVTDEEFPDFVNSTTVNFDTVSNKLDALNDKISIISSMKTKKDEPYVKPSFTPDQEQDAEYKARNILKRFGAGKIQTEKEPEMSELKENKKYQLNEMADPYEIWSTTGLPRASVERYIKSVLTLNSLLDSTDEDENKHADAIIRLFTNVLRFLENDLVKIKSDKKYTRLADTTEAIMLHLLVRLSSNHSVKSLNELTTDRSFSKIILKHTILELNRLLNTLAFLDKSKGDKNPEPLNTRGAPNREFRKLHLEPDEPSTLPPIDLFRESIDKMVDTIVGEQVAKWIK